MTIIEAILHGLMLFLFVFIVLAVLYVLILLFSQLVKVIEKSALKKEPVTAAATLAAALATAPAPAAPVPDMEGTGIWGGQVRLKNVDDQTAAMVMAIVSDETGIPLSQLVFKSISLVEPGQNTEEEA